MSDIYASTRCCAFVYNQPGSYLLSQDPNWELLRLRFRKPAFIALCAAFATAVSLVNRPNSSASTISPEEAKIDHPFDYHGLADFRGSIPIWTALGWKGDEESQMWLGLVYMNGWGAQRNYAAANRWFTLAAAQGNDKAKVYLGVMYLKGLGTTKNYREALSYFTSAGARSPEALNNLGYMYSHGYGVKRDYQKAVSFFVRSVDGGCSSARFSLGELYLNGLGVEKDSNKALVLFQDAANQREPHAMYYLGVMHMDGSPTGANKAEALKWFLTAKQPLSQLARNGDADAVVMLRKLNTEVARLKS